MYRGTTPTLRWVLKEDSIDLSEIKEIWFMIKEECSLQNDLYQISWFYNKKEHDEKHPLIIKTLSADELQLDTENKTISYTMTQEETLKFHEYNNAEVQLRILMNDDTALATPIKLIEIKRILKGGVIS